MQVFLHRVTQDEESYLDLRKKEMVTKKNKENTYHITKEIADVKIDRFYSDALAGKNGWEIIYDATEDKNMYPI